MSTINCPYQLGDTGPGGGIIVSLPNLGHNNTNFYYENSFRGIHKETRFCK